jgi:hypothetical protein
MVKALETREKIMSIILVYPKVAETFWSFKHALRVVGRSAAFPPLEALTAAAMLRSLWFPGIADKNFNRGYYWRLLKDGLSNYRQAFSDVVTMSIYGYHFRKLFWSPQVPQNWEDWWYLKGNATS